MRKLTKALRMSAAALMIVPLIGNAQLDMGADWPAAAWSTIVKEDGTLLNWRTPGPD